MNYTASGQGPYADDWEYSDFTATFPRNAAPWHSLKTPRPPVYPPLPPQCYRLIDLTVASLVRQRRAQGWEPVERPDAISLWKAGRVEFTVRRRDPLWALVTFQASFDVTLLSLRVRFRRRRPASMGGGPPTAGS